MHCVGGMRKVCATLPLCSLLAPMPCSAALAAAALATRTAAADETLGPLCTALADMIGLPESLVATYAKMLPEPPTGDFCTWRVAHAAHARMQPCVLDESTHMHACRR